MGRFCRICGQTRPNEKFSGKGHSRCICKKCQKKPKEEIALIETKDELMKYWDQSNISALNIKRLGKLIQFPCEDVQKLAHLTLAVALVKPHKKRRMKWLRQHKRDLYLRVREYFGKVEYLPEYEIEYIEDVDEPNNINELDSIYGYEDVEFYEALSLDEVLQSELDHSEPLPF